MRLGKRYSPARLEAACRRALTLEACAYKSLESILKKGLDRQPMPPPPDVIARPLHPHIRGPQYSTHDERGEPSCAHIPPSTNCRPCDSRVGVRPSSSSSRCPTSRPSPSRSASGSW